MTEQHTAEAYIYKILSTDSAIVSRVGSRIHSYIAPESSVLPVVIFNPMNNGTDRIIVGGNRIFTDCLYLVKVVGKNGFDPLDSIVERIDTLLHKTSGQVTNGGYVHQCLRVSQLSYPESTNGVNYYHRGGIYRLLVH